MTCNRNRSDDSVSPFRSICVALLFTIFSGLFFYIFRAFFTYLQRCYYYYYLFFCIRWKNFWNNKMLIVCASIYILPAAFMEFSIIISKHSPNPMFSIYILLYGFFFFVHIYICSLVCGLSALDLRISLLLDYVRAFAIYFFFILHSYCYVVYTPEIPELNTYHVG